jgi:hypothetical protein
VVVVVLQGGHSKHGESPAVALYVSEKHGAHVAPMESGIAPAAQTQRVRLLLDGVINAGHSMQAVAPLDG